jgi:hypothetical protein
LREAGGAGTADGWSARAGDAAKAAMSGHVAHPVRRGATGRRVWQEEGSGWQGME